MSQLTGFVLRFVDFFLHLDVHLNQVILDYGSGTYLILSLIVFCETGLVVTPILPGDSLLFAAGTFAATGSLNFALLFLLLSAAAVLGDAANYGIGRSIGPEAWESNSRFLKREYLQKTHRFYERYGAKTIVIARFVPIVRTFAPFLAGVGKMPYWTFATYNIAGGVVWILVCLTGGYFFGNLAIVPPKLLFSDPCGLFPLHTSRGHRLFRERSGLGKSESRAANPAARS